MNFTTRILLIAPLFILFFSINSNAQFVTNIAYFQNGPNCSTGEVLFVDSTNWSITSWNWDFGDGNMSTLANPTHTYAADGQYQVILTASDGVTMDSDTVFVNVAYWNVTTSSSGGGCSIFNCNGWGSINVTGGNPPYTYLWWNYQSGPTAQALCPGSNSVWITDQSGCTVEDSVVISNGPGINVSGVITNASCNNSDGAIDVTVTGGLPPYAFYWSTGASTEDVSSLPPGIYYLTVWDSSGCFDSTFYTITGNALNTFETVQNTGCGTATGSISISTSGGSGSYTYIWDPPVSTAASANNLSAGIYQITIDDGAGCLDSMTLEVFDSCGFINGIVFDDLNGNGIQDAGENNLSGITVILQPAGISTSTNSNGYFFPIPSFGSYTVEIIPPTNQFYCSGSVIATSIVSFPATGIHNITISASNPDSTAVNFGVAPPANPCGSVCGNVFNDANGNGVLDGGELGQPGVLIQLSNGFYAQTDANGDYCIDIPLNQTVTLEALPGTQVYYCSNTNFMWQQTFPVSPPVYSVTLTSTTPTSNGNDFGVFLSPSFDVGVYTIRTYYCEDAGMPCSGWMDFKVIGTTTVNCTLTLHHDPLIEFISASITPDFVGSDFVQWVFPPGYSTSWTCMGLSFDVDSAAVAGTDFEWIAAWDCGGVADGCPNNDTLVQIYTVATGPAKVSAHTDGFNVMQSYTTSDMANGDITNADSVFSYVINFQNTGTDTVFNLVIVDTLSPHLNVKTISQPFASKPYTFSIVSGNILVWQFDNIILPDSSSDMLHSYGFVQYNIIMKPDLPVGTIIEHNASYYYNYGAPKQSNTVSNKIVSTVDIEEPIVREPKINTFPNPSNGTFVVDLLLPEEKDASIEVFNSIGQQLVETITIDHSQAINLDLSDQANGIYLLKVSVDNRSYVRKLFLVNE